MSSHLPCPLHLSQPASRRADAPAGPVAAPRKEPPSATRLPTLSRPWLSWFTWYSRRYVRRHFHSLRLSRHGPPPAPCGVPLVIFSNHAAWWDPLVCLILKAHFFEGRNAYAPMAAAMLKRYPLFGRLGFFAVERASRRGAAAFVGTAVEILKSPNSLLAITPQSRLADARERPPGFESGLGFLATRVEQALFVPVALEYVFWEERLPEILIHFGEAVRVQTARDPSRRSAEWTQLLEAKLTAAQDALAQRAQTRNPDHFETLLSGGSGQGGVYDRWRWFKAKLRGETFQPEHGNK